MEVALAVVRSHVLTIKCIMVPTYINFPLAHISMIFWWSSKTSGAVFLCHSLLFMYSSKWYGFVLDKGWYIL